ncbi:hypothetical protein J6590_029074 [Homalodisca vitripennis]|nr:hypothetical protein J6590_029074 [Homalodisca vitripennis]
MKQMNSPGSMGPIEVRYPEHKLDGNGSKVAVVTNCSVVGSGLVDRTLVSRGATPPPPTTPPIDACHSTASWRVRPITRQSCKSRLTHTRCPALPNIFGLINIHRFDPLELPAAKGTGLPCRLPRERLATNERVSTVRSEQMSK